MGREQANALELVSTFVYLSLSPSNGAHISKILRGHSFGRVVSPKPATMPAPSDVADSH